MAMPRGAARGLPLLPRGTATVGIIGKYLRLRRELLEPGVPEQAPHRLRLQSDLLHASAALEASSHAAMPFLDTMPLPDAVDKHDREAAAD